MEGKFTIREQSAPGHKKSTFVIRARLTHVYFNDINSKK